MGQEKFNRMMASLGRDLRNLIGRSKTVSFVYGAVKEVDTETNTMSVSIDSEVTLPDISLAPIQGGNANALLYPKVGSVVIVGFVEDRPELSFVVAMTEVEELRLQFDFDSDPAVDYIVANTGSVTVFRAQDENNYTRFDLNRIAANLSLFRNGQLQTRIGVTDSQLTLQQGSNSVIISGSEVNINNGHLTIT
jgi:hypothetical protein